jgi:predicted XRE-type DNA-binding protein
MPTTKAKHHLPSHRVGSVNVFADLRVPNPKEAFAKAKLVAQIAAILQTRRAPQRTLAAEVSLDQAKVSRLLRGDTTGFSTDRLLGILARLGHDIEIRVGPAKSTSGILTVSGPAQSHAAAAVRKKTRTRRAR